MKLEQIKKTEEIEKLVRKDLGNGRHIQKRIKDRLSKAGKCSDSLCKKLESLKTVKA